MVARRSYRVANPAHAAKDLNGRVSKIMKIQYVLLVAIASVGLFACAKEKEIMVQSTNDQTQKRVHTQEELRKTGESQTGPALEKTDAAVRTSGRP